MSKENVVLITFRCRACNKLGGGCKVVDYADTLIRLMAPLGWHEQIDPTPGDTRMVSFTCPTCTLAAEPQQKGEYHATKKHPAKAPQ